MKKEILVIPGNPFVEYYYDLWNKEFNNDISFNYVNPTVLFSKKLSPSSYFEKLLLHYEPMLKKHSEKTQIILIGYSIGGFFSLELLNKYPERIKQVILLFPFLGDLTTDAKRVFNKLHFIDETIPISNFIINNIHFFEFFNENIKHISKKGLKSSLRLALNEHLYFLSNNLDLNLVDNHKDKLFMFYTKDDIWCPIKTIDKLKPFIKMKYLDTKHSFILYDNERKKVTKEILDII